jgi:predicted RNA-binding protein YlqC (UPF0109 family)
MKEFIEFVAKQLVDHPEEVQIDIEEREGKTVIKLKVGANEIGKIIGKRGRTAQAIRALLSAVAGKEGKRAILEILE